MKKLKLVIVIASIMFAGIVTPANAAQKHRRSTTRAPGLGDVGQFKAAFQADVGKVRLVALVSPT
jgi:hypothetical protein